MEYIRLENITKRYGDKTVLDRVSMKFEKGGVYCLMGPSGRGKTTLLRLIAGLERPDEGEISGVSGVSMMFQDNRLIPFMSAVDNCALPVKDKAAASRALTELGLGESLHKPALELSGGMARRVALARALIYEGGTLLLDEPFTGLDKGTANTAAEFIHSMRRGRTLIAVSHSLDEARLLGADIFRL